VIVILGLYVWAAGQGDWHPRKKTAGTRSVRARKPEKDAAELGLPRCACREQGENRKKNYITLPGILQSKKSSGGNQQK